MWFVCPWNHISTWKKKNKIGAIHKGGSSLKDKGTTRRKSFWKCICRGVNMLFKCVRRVVYNKSKCGSRGWGRWYGHFLNGVDSSNRREKLQKLPKLFKKWHLWTCRKTKLQRVCGWWLVHLELASFASTNCVLSFKIFLCMRAHVAPYCKFQLRTWTIFMHFNGKLL